MESRPVRLGWLSLLLTVIILCLATLSVLSFSTARADLALAQKQARQAQSVYALECAGQQWLAELDAALAQAGDTAELDALLPHGTAREGPGVSAVLDGRGRAFAFCFCGVDSGRRIQSDTMAAERRMGGRGRGSCAVRYTAGRIGGDAWTSGKRSDRPLKRVRLIFLLSPACRLPIRWTAARGGWKRG